jgi:hypothetical protein
MTETLATAMVAAQAEMVTVDKGKTVTVRTTKGTYSYSYATLDHMIALTRPILAKHGLSIVQLPTVTDTGGPGLKTTILHKSGESVSAVSPLFMASQDMQQLGSAITYARRYAWAAALGIAADEDDDGAATRSVVDPKAVERPLPASPVPQAGPTTVEPASTTGNFNPPDAVQERINAANASSTPPGDNGIPEEITLLFGKYKGKKLGELVDADVNYLTWLATKFEPKTADARRVKGAAMTILEYSDETEVAAAYDELDGIPFERRHGR